MTTPALDQVGDRLTHPRRMDRRRTDSDVQMADMAPGRTKRAA